MLATLFFLACVTQAAFPERFAEELCDWHDRCGNEWPEGTDCVDWTVENETVEYTACHADDWPADLANGCLDEIHADESCVYDLPACEDLRCE